jgi:hypothetical protein
MVAPSSLKPLSRRRCDLCAALDQVENGSAGTVAETREDAAELFGLKAAEEQFAQLEHALTSVRCGYHPDP